MMIRPFFLSLIIIFVGCDHLKPKRTFRMAIPEKDHSYNYSAQHLKEFLGAGGFNIEIVYTENAIEANRLVAEGSADLAGGVVQWEFG